MKGKLFHPDVMLSIFATMLTVISFDCPGCVQFRQWTVLRKCCDSCRVEMIYLVSFFDK